MKRVLIPALLAPTFALADQPQYISMAQCAGITQALSQHIMAPSKKRTLSKYVTLWTDEANRHSGMDMSPVIEETTEMWYVLGPGVVETQDFKDWADYCGRLARRIGLNKKAAAIKAQG